MTGLKKINRLVQKLLSFVYTLSLIDVRKILKNYRINSRNILWIKISSIYGLKNYIINNDLLDDLIIVSYLSNKKDFSIRFTKNIGKKWNSNIYFSITSTENSLNIYNYSDWLYTILETLEKQGNHIFPGKESVKMWENKIYMHEMFLKHSVPTPVTLILKHPFNNDYDLLNKDFLIKLPHSSGSKGVFHFTNYNHYFEDYHKYPIPPGSDLIIQERINMSFDLRVVINRFKYTSHYWRRNPINEPWRPTSTSRGSILTYEDIPIFIINLLQNCSVKLNLPFCAFDIAFQNDNLNTPLILEVSSSYQLNPNNRTNFPYKSYKEKIFTKYPYWKEYVDITINEKLSIIKYYEEKNNI